VWSAMADQLRREGGHLEVQPDASVTLTKNYQGAAHMVWVRTTKAGQREVCTGLTTMTWCADFDTGSRRIYVPGVDGKWGEVQ
jgi:hypothetical protein